MVIDLSVGQLAAKSGSMGSGTCTRSHRHVNLKKLWKRNRREKMQKGNDARTEPLNVAIRVLFM